MVVEETTKNKGNAIAPPNIAQSHTFSHTRALNDTTAHASPPSPPRPSSEFPPPVPRAPSNRKRLKHSLLETEMSPPPSAKRQQPSPDPPTRRQPKRTHPDSESTPPPPAKKSRTQNSNAPSLGRSKKGSERVAKQVLSKALERKERRIYSQPSISIASRHTSLQRRQGTAEP